MANAIRCPMEIALLAALLSVVYVNSSPINETTVVLLPPGHNAIGIRERSCHADTDCNNHGHCPSNATSCQCDRGWTFATNDAGLSEPCAYQQRSQQTAFFLSFFLGPLGVDWFYLSRRRVTYIAVGIFKLLLSCGCCGSWPLIFLGPETESFQAMKSRFRGVSTCFSLLAFAWWIVDWARILGGRFPDGNLVPLLPW